MALAAVIKSAMVRSGGTRSTVVVAAYGCPDLLAAIKYCHAAPKFVDIRDSLQMDLAQLTKLLQHDDDICAVVGVDLFGVSEDWEQLKEICNKANVLLIQDLAQSLQSKGNFVGHLQGDAAIVSFGRGKPLCLLKGGALLVPRSGIVVEEASIGELFKAYPVSQHRFSTWLRRFYNFVIAPRPYYLLAKIMGDRLGATNLVPLQNISTLSEQNGRLIDLALEEFWSDYSDRYSAVLESMLKVCDRHPERIKLPTYIDSGIRSDRIYTRLPVLVESKIVRNSLVKDLVASGIGATIMYGRALCDFATEARKDSDAPGFPGARKIADQLLTLPTHCRLSSLDIECIEASFERCLAKT